MPSEDEKDRPAVAPKHSTRADAKAKQEAADEQAAAAGSALAEQRLAAAEASRQQAAVAEQALAEQRVAPADNATVGQNPVAVAAAANRGALARGEVITVPDGLHESDAAARERDAARLRAEAAAATMANYFAPVAEGVGEDTISVKQSHVRQIKRGKNFVDQVPPGY